MRDRPFRRYFTLTHLYNAGLSAEELQSYRHGLSKLINSLSWGKQIVPPAGDRCGADHFPHRSAQLPVERKDLGRDPGP